MGLFGFGKKKDDKKSSKSSSKKKTTTKKSSSKKKAPAKKGSSSKKAAKKGPKKKSASKKQSKKSASKKKAAKKPAKKTPEKKAVKQDNEQLIKEKVDEGWLHAKIILEMLGAPKEHILKTFNEYLKLIEEDKEIIVLGIDKEEPQPQKELWSVFADLDLLFPDASALVFFCFDYMPSSVDILEPAVFHYRAKDFSDFFNDLQAKLHKLDFYAKNLTAENKNLKRNANLLLRNNIMIVLKYEKGLSLDELSKKVGIPEEQLEPFLETMTKDGHITKKGDTYSRQ